MIKLHQGDCREVLAKLPAESVQTCVTSPPYYGLRAYLPDGHPDKASEIGLEQSPAEYVAQLVEVFREVRRVLRTDGTVWLNLGDSYATQGGAHGGRADNQTGVGAKRTHLAGAGDQRPRSPAPGLKPKDLMMIPARVAIALQEPWHVGPIKREVDRAWLAGFVDGDGCIGIRQQANGEWNPTYIPYLTVGSSDTALLERCVAITGLGSVNQKSSAGDTDARGIKQRRDGFTWRLDGQIASRVIRDIYPYLVQKKPQALVCNAMNLSQGEPRPTKTRPVAADIVAYRSDLYVKIKALNQRQLVDLGNLPAVEPNIEPGFYLRSEIIWSKSAPMPESVRDRPTCAHEKVWLLTKAATYFYDADAVAEQADPKNHRSSPGVRDTPPGQAQHSGYKEGRFFETRNLRNVWHLNPEPFPGAHFATMPATLAERCIKAGSRPGDTVLDPFAGAGTTLLVADRLQRDAVGIELNADYCALIRKRLASDAPLLSEVA